MYTVASFKIVEEENKVYFSAWFKTLEEAKNYQSKEHSGVLYKNEPRSRTKESHLITAAMFHFDPDEYPYSVNWNCTEEEVMK